MKEIDSMSKIMHIVVKESKALVEAKASSEKDFREQLLLIVENAVPNWSSCAAICFEDKELLEYAVPSHEIDGLEYNPTIYDMCRLAVSHSVRSELAEVLNKFKATEKLNIDFVDLLGLA